MTQPLKNSSNPRRVPSRSALESVRPATAQAARNSETAGLEPPVLLKLADFTHLAGRRGSRRGAVKLPPIPTTLPVPVVALPADELLDDERLDDVVHDEPAEPQDRKLATLETAPQPDEPEVRLHEEQPVDSLRPTSSAAEVKTRSLPSKKEAAAAASPLIAPSEAPVTSGVEASIAAEIAKPREAGTAASRRARPAADVADKSAPVAAHTTAPTPVADSAEDAPSFWDRVGSFRPSIPVLLVLVLATIGVAYVYRPQETPPKRRGSLERAEPKRLFGSEFDAQRPKPLTTGDSRATPAAADMATAEPSTTGRGADLRLDVPTNASERAASKSDSPTPASNGRPPQDSSTGSADPASRLATRPAPTEHFDSTPPPPMPVEAPLESDDAATATDEEDDGPPPDITGRSYPVTSPSSFFYRPQPVESPTPDLREASRPTSGGPR